jgi:hypothetical protein
MSNVAINIAAEYTGKPAFDKANKSVTTLERNVKKLASGLGLALGTTAMAAYGKAAFKAFAADEAAARRLATAVDNLGLSFSQAKVTTFIADLEKSASIADDILRPAFQALLTTTGSLTKSQELLNNAIQISRASGVDLATVSQDLANGYVGITRGLKKYNTGLTQAELKSKSFADILGIMLVKSAGSANAYLETTQYKLDALTLAGNNAKETIGAGLVDAFARIAGGSETSDAVKAIDNIAKAINGVTAATGFLVGGLVKLYKGLDFLTTFGGLTGANGSLVGILEGKPSTNRSKSPAGTAARTAQQRAAETAAAARAKELAGLTKKQVASQKALTAEQKRQNALKKAGTVFDLDQIQLVAALKGKLSEDDKIRLQAQLALLNGNADLATRLTNQILAAQDSTGNLAKFLSALPNAKNPFEYLDAYLSYLAGKAAAVLTGTTAPNVPSTTASAAAMPTPSEMAASGSFSQLVSQGAGASGGFSPVVAAAMAPQVIELKITGDGDLTNTIAKNLMQQSLSTGNQTYVNRRTGGFE